MKSETYINLRDMLIEMHPFANAGEMHWKIGDILTSLGFSVTREYPVEERGDGRSGRIDLLAEGHGLRIAMELDRKTPRKHSIEKLRRIPDAIRLILLREPGTRRLYPYGIDEVIVVGGMWQ